ncbi:MAG: ATP-dependent 6-phosphofructokinase [Verrucomicrobiota bacterium]
MPSPAVTPADLNITSLGPRRFPSPGCVGAFAAEGASWHSDGDRILLDNHMDAVRGAMQSDIEAPSIELAGPRREIYFKPADTCCAIVTCGGLCPGINDVIRAIVMQAHYTYGVGEILGIQYGYEGLDPAFGHKPIELTPDLVRTIPTFGGSFLGSSRGQRDTKVMVNRLEALGVNILFVIGGDGSQRGAQEIYQEAQRRGSQLAVVGVPKTIDNDLMFMDRSFGYQTAFTMAFHAVAAAHTEARGARNGVGLVKLMGRDSGFIACSAALATGEANAVLIPEVPFKLKGPHGLFAMLEERLATRGHAVIIAAEGAGQDLMAGAAHATDASGNLIHADIGLFLKDQICSHFKARQLEINLKYIDPSYLIRSVPAAPDDRVFCLNLGRHAVHAGMAGKTGMVVALLHQSFVHLPMSLVTRGRRKVDPTGDLWRSVVESTGQPARMGA